MNDGRKKKPQKHKNKTAFKITFDTQALELQKKVSLNNLCVRCTQQIEWKLQYNKYKKMSEPGRCNLCQQKNVYRTYMKACQQCVESHNICAKCLTPDYEQPEQVKVLEKDQKKQQKVEYNKQIQFMKTLQQRSRRTVRRGLQKGKISWDNQQQYFVDEEGNKMIGLHFRKGFKDSEQGDQDNEDDVMDEDMMDDDDDMFGSNEEELDDEQQEQPKNNKVSEQQKKQKEDKDNEKESKQQGNSDIEGDEVDCENDIDFGDEAEDDFDSDDWEQQEQEEEAPKKQKQKKGQK